MLDCDHGKLINSEPPNKNMNIFFYMHTTNNVIDSNNYPLLKSVSEQFQKSINT